ncbi:zinc finger matrin-type protein 5 isoform X1 [Zootoca vivipara]|uniref:zinc finger matrin-type protein 5 isoform X1 n=1 Tax=Zootoca vivipara TaxID=8524 RepID=UPI00293B9B6A|nr:zinc finger matrin-type protein 5 isoform X1 [Zootoca vivipara]
MGKRYFCDYCNRSFQDNLHNRKKHLNGVQHLRAKKVWYDLFRDSATILQEEQSKKPCREFLLSGRCDFGPNCRFSHMTEEDLEQLNAHVQVPSRRKSLFSSIHLVGLRSRIFHLPCRLRLLVDGGSHPISNGDDCADTTRTPFGTPAGVPYAFAPSVAEEIQQEQGTWGPPDVELQLPSSPDGGRVGWC